MFKKIYETSYRPERPILIWDGTCKFCQYWILRLQKHFYSDLDIIPYQKLDLERTGISRKAFSEAARLIDRQGKVYSGPEVFYKSLKSHFGDILLSAYQKHGLFRWFNDYAYHLIAKNRALFFRITKGLWGKNPRKPKYYWVLYLSLFIILIMAALIYQ